MVTRRVALLAVEVVDNLRSGGAVGLTAFADEILDEARTIRVLGILVVDERVGRIGGIGCLLVVLTESVEDLLVVLVRRCWLLTADGVTSLVFRTLESRTRGRGSLIPACTEIAIKELKIVILTTFENAIFTRVPRFDGLGSLWMTAVAMATDGFRHN